MVDRCSLFYSDLVHGLAAGPAAALQAARFIKDSRDDKSQERLSELEDAYSIFRCRSIMNCVNACPKGLNPTGAIRDIRKKMLDEGI